MVKQEKNHSFKIFIIISVILFCMLVCSIRLVIYYGQEARKDNETTIASDDNRKLLVDDNVADSNDNSSVYSEELPQTGPNFGVYNYVAIFMLIVSVINYVESIHSKRKSSLTYL